MEWQKCDDNMNIYKKKKEQFSDIYERQCEKIIIKKQCAGTKSNQHSPWFIRSKPHPAGNHTNHITYKILLTYVWVMLICKKGQRQKGN